MEAVQLGIISYNQWAANKKEEAVVNAGSFCSCHLGRGNLVLNPRGWRKLLGSCYIWTWLQTLNKRSFFPLRFAFWKWEKREMWVSVSPRTSRSKQTTVWIQVKPKSNPLHEGLLLSWSLWKKEGAHPTVSNFLCSSLPPQIYKEKLTSSTQKRVGMEVLGLSFLYGEKLFSEQSKYFSNVAEKQTTKKRI